MPLFTGYDSDQLMAQMRQRMIDNGYWNDQIWGTDSGQLLLRLMSELIAVNNYSVNRVYEESFDETARRIGTIVQSLHRKGFDFNKVLENNMGKSKISTQYGNFLAYNNSFPSGPILTYFTLRVNFSGKLKFKRVGMTEDYENLFNFYNHDWFNLNTNSLVAETVVPLDNCNYHTTITSLGQFMSAFNLLANDANVLVAESILARLVETTKTFSISSLNYELITSGIVSIMELIIASSVTEIKSNRWETLDYPKAYLSIAQDGRPSLKLEEHAIGSTGSLHVLENAEPSASLRTDNIHMDNGQKQYWYEPDDGQRQYWFESDEFCYVKITGMSSAFATAYSINGGTYDEASDSYKVAVSDLIYDVGNLGFRRVGCSFTGGTGSGYFVYLSVDYGNGNLFECMEATETTFRLQEADREIDFAGFYRETRHQLFFSTASIPLVFDVSRLKAFIKTKLFSNNALVSTSDVNSVLAQVAGLTGSNAYDDSGIKVCIYPDKSGLRDVVTEILQGSFFSYTFQTTKVLNIAFKGTVYHDGTLDPAVFGTNFGLLQKYYNETLTFGEALQLIKSYNPAILDMVGKLYHSFYINQSGFISFNETAGVNQDLFELVFSGKPEWNVTLTAASGTYSNAGMSITWTFTKATGTLVFTLNWVAEIVPFYVLLGRNNASLQTKNDEVMIGEFPVVEYVS